MDWMWVTVGTYSIKKGKISKLHGLSYHLVSIGQCLHSKKLQLSASTSYSMQLSAQ